MKSRRTEVSFEKFADILSTAFLPYQCSFYSEDHGNGFSFKVLEDGKPILGISHHNRKRITEGSARSIISQTRAHLREVNGVTLKAWRFPVLGDAT